MAVGSVEGRGRGPRGVSGGMLPVVGLAVAAFIFNTSEFMPVGLLTDIAASFSLTEAQAGVMISVYAWGVMALSLPLMMAGSRLAPRRLLLAVVAVFLAGQVASALAPTFGLLVAARLLVAAAHAVFWSVATPLAARIVDERRSSAAMGMVVTGSSVALIFGMPLGRMVGLALGWRMTFACVAVSALAVLLLLAALMPRVGRDEPFTLAKLPTLLRNRALVAVYVVVVAVTVGYYTGYSYIEPFLQQVAGLGELPVTGCLTVFGLAGVAGSALFSRLHDGHRRGFPRVMVLGVAVALLLMAAAGAFPASAAVVCALWGTSSTAFNLAFQSEVIRVTPADSSAVAMSIYSGLFNLGIGCGTALGGAVVTGLGIGSVGLVGGAVGLLGFALCCALVGRGGRAAVA